MKQPMVYIVTNKKNGTLYTGVTSRPVERIYEHKNGLKPGFTKKYGCNILVYFELHNHMALAIAREKQIKAGSRRDKIDLIQSMNPDWTDLYCQLIPFASSSSLPSANESVTAISA